MNKKEIIDSFKNKQAFFFRGDSNDIKFRLNTLKKLKSVIRKSEKDILSALKQDLGKPEIEAYLSEIYFTLIEINFMIKNLKKLSKPETVKHPLTLFASSSYIYPEPYGIVLIIAPWNYPFQLAMLPLAGAIAAGNCVIVKPSELAPATEKIIATILSRACVSDHVSAITGGIKESEILLSQPFDYIFYTGSTNVGKIVMRAASENLIPVTLELGGKSPCIVDYDVNIDIAAKRIVKGKFFNAGQTCVAPDYVFVHYSIKNKLIKAMQKHIREFYGDDPSQSPDYARIVNERHFDRLIKYLSNADNVFGGRYEKSSLYIEPTLQENVKTTKPVMKEEIFGPILPILEYKDVTEAINYVNENSRPLALYLFSANKLLHNRVINETSSGGVCINDTLEHITNDNLPFGGIGASGMGAYHGKKSFDTFTHYKSVLRKGFSFDVKVKYPPYEISLAKLKTFLKWFS